VEYPVALIRAKPPSMPFSLAFGRGARIGVAQRRSDVEPRLEQPFGTTMMARSGAVAAPS
jgi:hypothetical protein